MTSPIPDPSTTADNLRSRETRVMDCSVRSPVEGGNAEVKLRIDHQRLGSRSSKLATLFVDPGLDCYESGVEAVGMGRNARETAKSCTVDGGKLVDGQMVTRTDSHGDIASQGRVISGVIGLHGGGSARQQRG